MLPIPHAIRTSYGPCSIELRPMMRASLTLCEAHTLAGKRQADNAEREGALAADGRLRGPAAALQEAAR